MDGRHAESGPARGARQPAVRAARTHHATAPERTDRRAGAAPCASSWSAAGRGKRCQRRPGEARGFRGSGTKGSPWPGSADVRGAPAPRGARRGLAFVCGTAARSPGEAPAPSGRRGFESRPATDSHCGLRPVPPLPSLHPHGSCGCCEASSRTQSAYGWTVWRSRSSRCQRRSLGWAGRGRGGSRRTCSQQDFNQRGPPPPHPSAPSPEPSVEHLSREPQRKRMSHPSSRLKEAVPGATVSALRLAQPLPPVTQETGGRGGGAGGRGQVARSGSVIKCLRISSCCPFCSPAPSRFYLSEMCSNISSRPWGTGSACNAGVTFWRMNATFVSICRSEY